MGDGAYVLRITLHRNVIDETYGSILISYPHREKIKTCLSKALRGNSALKVYDSSVEFKLEPGVIAKLIEAFKELNKEYSRIEFPEILFADLQGIENYHFARPFSSRKHLVKKRGRITVSNINPDRAKSTQLLTWFNSATPNNQLAIRKIKECLKDGEDPNQFDSSSATPLKILFHKKNINEAFFKWALRYLIIYKAYLGRLFIGEYSVLENAAQFDPMRYGWFLNAISSRLKRPVLYTPLQIQSLVRSTRLETIIIKNNLLISTVTKKSSELSEDESNELFQLFSDNFEASSDTNISAVFQEDFYGANKYVEIIYHNGEIIGFSLYENITLKAYPNHVFLYWIDAAIKADYRRKKEYRIDGLITLLAFRTAMLLQILHPESIVGMFCVSITASSGVLFSNLSLLYHPQYGSHDELVKAILKKIGSNTTYFRDNASCLVSQPVRVKQTPTSATRSSSTLEQTFFNEEMIQHQDNAYKGVPILLFIGDQTYSHLSRFFASQFNFREYINQLASEVARRGFALYEGKNYSAAPINLNNVNKLFWRNELVKEKKKIEITEARKNCAL